MFGNVATRRAGPPLDVPFTINRNSVQSNLYSWVPMLGERGAALLRNYIGFGVNSLVFPGGANNPTWVTDAEHGAALNFDGSGDFINLQLALDGGGRKSLSVWVRPSSASAGYVISNYTATSNGVSILYNSDRTIGISWTGAINVVRTTDAIPLNQWTLITATYETGTTGGKIYLNGVLSTSGNLGTEITAPFPLRLSGRWVSGTNFLNATGTAATFPGRMFDFRYIDDVIDSSVIWQMWAPETRWELYEPVTRPIWVLESAVGGGGTIPVIYHHLQQQGIG